MRDVCLCCCAESDCRDDTDEKELILIPDDQQVAEAENTQLNESVICLPAAADVDQCSPANNSALMLPAAAGQSRYTQ